MNWGDMLITILVALIAGSVPGLVAWFRDRKKNNAETEKVAAETEKAKAETKSIYAEVADRWAEHVDDLVKKINRMDAEREADKLEIKGLRIDIAQIRRENEEYRRENADLKDWAERLSAQFSRHVPHIPPAPFIHRDRTNPSNWISTEE